MKLFYNWFFVLAIMIAPFALQSQDDPISDDKENWNLLLPDDETFLSMTAFEGDGTADETEVPSQPCPSTERRKYKVKVTVSAQNTTEAKKKLKKYKAKHEASKEMNDLLKTKFSCVDCDLPDVTPCTLSVSNVVITFSNPKKVSDGIYSSTLTIKYDANCTGCEIQVNLKKGIAIRDFVSIFPNPVSDAIRIKVKLEDGKENVQFRILDSAGKVVKLVNVTPSGLILQKDIEVSDLKGGIYFLESTQGKLLKDITQFIKMN